MRDLTKLDGRCRTCGRPLGGDEHEVDGVPGVFHLECLPASAGVQIGPAAWMIRYSDGSGDLVFDGDEADDLIAESREGATKLPLYFSALGKRETLLQFLADEGQLFDRTNTKDPA